MTTATATNGKKTYRGEATRAVAIPLGGIGTGTIALAGDGSLRQWQIHNQINHLACVPQSFFAIRAERSGEQPVAKVLQSSRLYGTEPDSSVPNTSSDHVVPLCHQRLMQQLPGVADVEFGGTYPIAELAYIDDALPVDVMLEAFSPFVPLDARASGIPAIVFNFTVMNPGDAAVEVSIAASLQNSVGWDGISPIFDTRCELYGGNINHVHRSSGRTSISMECAGGQSDQPGWGSLALTAHAPDVSALAHWSSTPAMWDDFVADGRFEERPNGEPSAHQRTWNAALAVPFMLDPGETRTIPFSIAWYFPNRYIDQEQAGLLGIPQGQPSYRIGNRYNREYDHALDVVRYLDDNLAGLSGLTRTSRDLFLDTTLPRSLVDTVTSQMSIIRSPTCFWTEDGHFYGFEGCNGASTQHHALPYGGCCPLNCTHVWNYDMALARLFPGLERSMRDVEWKVQQQESGFLPHRVILPLNAPRAWDFHQLGPDKPALDGLLGAILKTYREYRASGDAVWLSSSWPSARLALDYIWREFDREHTGVIEAEQPNTYDISIFGANTFIGSLYLAALRAIEEMARLQDDTGTAEACRATFERGRDELERRLWNGEYYIQEVDLAAHPEQNWATGCHSDQLLGQWWAHALDLGYVLDPNHVRAAVKAIVAHNFRTDFRGIDQGERAFVSDFDEGLVLCTWPRGGRPPVPTRYSDEVWAGIEYEVAALLLYEGEPDLAMKLIEANRRRHDGTRLNPWNDIECGDHYVRSLASWSVLEAASGFSLDAASGTISFNPVLSPGDFRGPFFSRDGWGTYTQVRGETGARHAIEVVHGRVDVGHLRISTDRPIDELVATVTGEPVTCSHQASGEFLTITPEQPWILQPENSLFIEVR